MTGNLSDYRAIELRCDFATDWMAPIQATTGDLNGRTIRVVLTDGGKEVASDGIIARLVYDPSPNNPTTFGDRITMQAIPDQPTATFEAPIPSSLLASTGRKVLGIQFVTDDGQSIICTRPFDLHVESGVLKVTSGGAVGEFEDAVSRAEQAAESAKTSSESAAESERLAAQHLSDIGTSKDDAVASANAAESSANAAETSAGRASESASTAETHAVSASESADRSAASEQAAAASAQSASESATRASQSEESASVSAEAAAESAGQAREYINGFDLSTGEVSKLTPESMPVFNIRRGEAPGSYIIDVGMVQGEQGDQGEPGPRGEGLRIDHAAASEAELPSSGVDEGETGMVNGDLYVWDGSRWAPQGNVKGVDGVTPDISMSATIDSSTGSPTVTVTREGDKENPRFHLSFSGLKGETPTIATDTETIVGSGRDDDKLSLADGTILKYATVNSGSIDELRSNGIHGISNGVEGLPAGEVKGILIVAAPQGTDVITQTLISHWTPETDDGHGGIWLRHWTQTTETWTGWSQVAYMSDLETMVSSVTCIGRTITVRKADGSSTAFDTQDTTYAPATTSSDGLMSSEDKSKLDELHPISTIDLTVETDLFKTAMKARKTVDGLGTVNLISPKPIDDNMKTVQNSTPWFADHDDNPEIPENMIEITCAHAPSSDMRFTIIVLETQ